MDYFVKLTRTAAAAVINLHPDIKKKVKRSFKELAADPYSGKELQEELAGFFTYRIKSYRIVYKVAESEKNIIVYMIGHRRDVYELFAELINAQKG